MRSPSLTFFTALSAPVACSDAFHISTNGAGCRIEASQLMSTSRSVDAEVSESTVNRRKALFSILGGATTMVAAAGSNALDFDSFVNSELNADTTNCNPKTDPKCKPKLSDDEALCKYGQSGAARGEACKKVKDAGGSLAKPGSQGKSLGGAYAM